MWGIAIAGSKPKGATSRLWWPHSWGTAEIYWKKHWRNWRKRRKQDWHPVLRCVSLCYLCWSMMFWCGGVELLGCPVNQNANSRIVSFVLFHKNMSDGKFPQKTKGYWRTIVKLLFRRMVLWLQRNHCRLLRWSRSSLLVLPRCLTKKFPAGVVTSSGFQQKPSLMAKSRRASQEILWNDHQISF